MSDDDILESAEPSATPDDAPKRPVELERRSLYRHPLAAVGGSLIASGAFAFVLLSAVDIAAEHENPYRSLVTFVGAPAIFTLGIILFFIAARLQIRKARLAGDDVQFMLRVEPSNPRYMRNLWIFLGLTFVFLAVVGWSGFKAYEATETVGFCGESCHVMDPQNVTYVNGPHARVPCVDWHMQTCEGCHWPEQFFGQKLTERTYYRTDEANSPWSISLLVNVGGGNPRTGELEGIHWHMLSAKVVEYIASDTNRQVIPWVRVTDPETGEVKVFTDPNADIPDPTDPETDLRLFDCMDCHNRPSHAFDPPAISLNLELSKGNISRDLPFVRKVGLELINADYETKQEATAAIASGLLDYYAAEYPQVAASRTIEIDAAIDVMQRIYSDNFFPEQKTDYRERTNNLSHFANNGCFRCHFTDMQTASGERMLSSTCESCHAIVAQGPTDNVLELEDDLAGLKFIHPADIGGVWETVKCSQCHNPASGY
jgi:hypothetical protein